MDDDQRVSRSQAQRLKPVQAEPARVEDPSGQELAEFRKTVYLTIMSSLEFQECCHKLLRLGPKGREAELCRMIIECCSQEKTFGRFYGQLVERLCRLDPMWARLVEQCFEEVYAAVHRYEISRIRNLGQLFGYLLVSDSISWRVLRCIRLTETETTAASRILVKIVFEDLKQEVGMPRLVSRFKDPTMATHYVGLFPRSDNQYARDYFRAIHMGELADSLLD